MSARERRPMRRRKALWWGSLVAVLAVAAGAAVAVSKSDSGSGSRESAAGAPSAQLTAATTHAAPTTQAAASPRPAAAPQPGGPLSPQQIAGQHIIYSYPGLTPPPELFDRIRAGEVAGVIFFAENVANEQQLAGVSAQLQQAAMQSPEHLPLLLMTDQEGGQVRRLPGGPEASAKQIGQSPEVGTAASQAGAQAAAAMHAAGANANLAPVLGVYRQPGDFLDQYGRSFGSDPQLVGEAGSRFIAAQQRDGVAAAAKHFPGLGAAPASANTDEVPVTIDTPAATIRSVDEAPYRQAIAQGVDMVMPSWAVYPALDPARPAGLSPTIVRGELRDRLGYRGVTVTDALEAGALQAFGDYGNRAVLATQAGMDLLLCSARSVAQGDQAAAGLSQAIASGQIDQADLAASTARILELRASLR
ncbi:glycoside hydrolase family 3 N-terminal domain-containing protein [Speluncibacter jeojiensis]|uniref:glycoside hydrolase family 3 N-terminal domain-containing protein n=1 Tax=Speluncibacter jeojiensis TaxID=2710754 RepID=UPI00240F87AA|nr:glycoside hydrolase family 3 N-terminal domain-containing protein [Rhodococcus sp. D2-41]